MHSASKNPIEIAAADEKNTPLHYLCAYNEVEDAKKLIENEDPEVRVAVDAENSSKETPLHQAVRNNAVDATRYLVNECSADINHLDINHCSPLAFAIAFGYIDCLKIMANKSGDIAKQTINGHPILCFAAHHGHLPIVWYLILQKADVNALTPGSNTPLYFAMTSLNLADKPAMIKLLLASGAKITPEILEVAKYNDSLYQYMLAEFSRRCLTAICQNNPEAFEQLGGKSIVEIRNKDGLTPLEQAIANNKLTMVIYLVNTCEADLEAKNEAGLAPYQQADSLGPTHQLIKKYLQGAWKAKKRAAKQQPTKNAEIDEESKEDKPSKSEKEKKRRALLKKRKQQLQQASRVTFQSKPKSQQSTKASGKKDKTELKSLPAPTFQLPTPSRDGLDSIFHTLAQRASVDPHHQQRTSPHSSHVGTKKEPAPKPAVLSFASIINKLKPLPVEPSALSQHTAGTKVPSVSVPTLTIPPKDAAATGSIQKIVTEPVIDASKTASATPILKADDKPIQTPGMLLTPAQVPARPAATPTITEKPVQPPPLSLESAPLAGSISPLALPAPALASTESKRHHRSAPPLDLKQFLSEKNVYLQEDTIAWMAWLQRHSFCGLSGGGVRDSFKPIPCDPNDLDFYFFNIGKILMHYAAASGLSGIFHLCEYVQYLYQCKSSELPLDINCVGNTQNYLERLYHFSINADFTVNSIIIWLKDPNAYRAPSTPLTIISFDPNNGWQHLTESVLQLCGPKDLEEKRFADDPSIIFRFFRTAFGIRKKDGSMPENYSHYLSLSKKYAHSLHKTSSINKISDEFSKCVLRGNGVSIINMMTESKILDPLFFPAEDKDRQPLVPSSQGYGYFLDEVKKIDNEINQINFRNMPYARKDLQLSIYRSRIYGMIIGLSYLDFARKTGGVQTQALTNKMHELLTNYNVLYPRKLDFQCIKTTINKTISQCLAAADQSLKIASSCEASMFATQHASAVGIKKQTPISPPSPA